MDLLGYYSSFGRWLKDTKGGWVMGGARRRWSASGGGCALQAPMLMACWLCTTIPLFPELCGDRRVWQQYQGFTS